MFTCVGNSIQFIYIYRGYVYIHKTNKNNRQLSKEMQIQL